MQGMHRSGGIDGCPARLVLPALSAVHAYRGQIIYKSPMHNVLHRCFVHALQWDCLQGTIYCVTQSGHATTGLFFQQ